VAYVRVQVFDKKGYQNINSWVNEGVSGVTNER
jgi:hypothetical protein